MWRGIALSTYFSPIWFWQRDEGGNPSIPLICYILILTERCGGFPPFTLFPPSDTYGEMESEIPLFTFIPPSDTAGEMWGKSHIPTFPPSDTRVDMWGECLYPSYFPPSDTIIEMWGIHPINFSPYNTRRERCGGNLTINLLSHPFILMKRCGGESLYQLTFLLSDSDREM